MQATGVKGFRLSTQQTRVWALQQQGAAYYSLIAVYLEGKLDNRALLHALQKLVDRHDILRTSFFCPPNMDVPLQVVAASAEVACPLIDLERLSTSRQTLAVERCVAALRCQVASLEKTSLLLSMVLRLQQERSVLFLCLPALCADSFALAQMLRELAHFYQAGGEALEDPLQYTDVSAWQNNLLGGENAQAGYQFWGNIDPGEASALPFNLYQSTLPPGAVQSVSAEDEEDKRLEPCMLETTLSEELSARLLACVQQQHVSASSWLLACWYVLLWRQKESIPPPGLTCDGRNYEELFQVPGLLARTVPVNLAAAPDLPFEQFAILVHRACQEAKQWQTYFTRRTDHASAQQPDGLPSFPGEYAIHFEYTLLPGPARSAGLVISPLYLLSYTEPFRLKLHVLQIGQGFQLQLHYQRSALTARESEQLRELLQALLEATVERPRTALAYLPLFGSAREQQMLRAARGPTRALPAHCLHQLFEEQVRLYPERPALLCRDEAVSYQQLNRQANQLARYLRCQGVGPNMLVGLCVERSVQMITALLAILKAGGAYLPLDPRYPAERLLAQIKQSQVRLLVTGRHLAAHFSAWDGTILDLEALAGAGASEAGTDLPSLSDPLDLAYVMYTSGSTGQPKGVMITQRNIVNYTLDLCRLLGSQPGWQYATVSTLAADLGNTAVFGALASGGCLHILPYETLTSAQEMADWMHRHPIDVLKIVPSHLSALLAAGDAAGALLPRRALILGGEALSWKVLERVRQLDGKCAVYNHYGPTEATIGVLLNEVTAQPLTGLETASAVPLGRPLANSEAYILDQRLQLVPPGVVGELYLGGAGLAPGYLSQSAQTAGRFIPHPWTASRGSRLYRTGDLAWSTDQGVITFVGRRDTQVKLRGHRIELAEIEAVLARHPQIREAIVVHRDDGASPHLAGYIVPQSQSELTGKAVSDFLHTWLPEYMIPARFLFLKKFPLNANGKVDRQALLAHDVSSQEQESAPPRTLLEEMLLDIWQDLLQVPTLGVHDNFFDVGGHSLLATQVIGRARAVLHIELSILDLFESPTVAQLAGHVEQALRGTPSASGPELVPVSRAQDLPLSFAQQRLWFLHQLEPESTAYLVPLVRRLRGALDSRALGKSLRALMQRHETLRTTFVAREGHPIQVIHASAALPLRTVDLRELAADKRESEARRLARQEARVPCDLARGPLLRVTHLRLAMDEHLLLFTLHHSISDAWSNEIFFRELSLLYHACLNARPVTLAPLPVQYADYAVWQRQWLQGEVLETHLAYWRRQLADVPVLDLPTDYPRPPLQTSQGSFRSLTLPASLTEQLAALRQREGATLFMLLLAAFQILLARYTGQFDISLGTPVTHRSHVELERLVGFFVNTLVLRNDLSGNPSFLHVLRAVRHSALQAYVHQDIPFEYLVEILQPERDLSRSPLFQVMFSVVEPASVDIAASELWQFQVTREVDATAIATKFDLEMTVMNAEQGLRCGIAYRSDLFTERTIGRMLAHFQVLLAGIVLQPEQKIAYLPLLTADEQRQLLVEWNQTRQDYPLHLTFAHLFARQAALSADCIALSHGDTCLTYQALDWRARQTAAFLKSRGIGLEKCVGILLERSIELLIAILAVFQAGGVYIPLDPSFPAMRLAHIIEQAALRVIIARSPWRSQLAGGVATVAEITETWESAGQALSDPEGCAQGEQLAYVIYTSGSTGQPKGAMLTSRGMLNHLFAKIAALRIDSRDVVAQTASQCFDISLWQMLAALLVGGQVRIVSDEIVRDPHELCQEVAEARISLLEMVPALMRAIVESRDAQSGSHPWETSLRRVIATGELLPADLVRNWQELYPRVALLNAYGPTECSDDVTHACLDAARAGISRPVDAGERASEGLPARAVSAPIGRALANTQLYVLDEMFQPVPVGVAGQLYVGGVGVGRGYLADPARTAGAFLPDPFSTRPGARLYKTGDLARYCEDGQLEFLRRKDEQVKLRGYRIEPGEIEAALAQHARVQQSVVLLQGEEGPEKQLVAYVVPGRGEEALPDIRADLRAFLRTRLPEYMIPASFVLLDALPLTAHGKVDRRRLCAHRGKEEEHQEQREAQRQFSQVEELVAQCWQQVLQIEQPGSHDNFFAAGGHSLLATRLVARLRQLIGIEIPLRTIFEAPSIAEQAAWIEDTLRQRLEVEMPPLRPNARDCVIPLSFAQQRLWFLDQLEPGNIAYTIPIAMRLQGKLHKEVLERSFRALIQRHESLRTIFGVTGDQPHQIIVDQVAFHCPVIDLENLAARQREVVARGLLQQVVQRPFDLLTGPLLRVFLLDLQSADHVLLLTMHHIISDGWSTNVLIYELGRLYQAFSAGQASPLSALPVQYADFALWQRAWLTGAALERRLVYWTRQLGGHRPLRLPTDYPRPEIPTYRGADYAFVLETTLSSQLLALSHQEGVTLFMTLLAAFQVLLYRWTGQVDILVGTDVANRTHVETEQLIGFFINLLVLRSDLSDIPSFREVLRRTRETVLDAYACQDTPFEMLVERLLPGHVRDRMPLVQVLFVLQNQPVPSIQVSDLALSHFAGAETMTAKFDLALFMQESSQYMRGIVKYNSDLFDRETIATLIERFKTLLHCVGNAPDTLIDLLELSTTSEKARQAERYQRSLRKLKTVRGEEVYLPEL